MSISLTFGPSSILWQGSLAFPPLFGHHYFQAFTNHPSSESEFKVQARICGTGPESLESVLHIFPSTSFPLSSIIFHSFPPFPGGPHSSNLQIRFQAFSLHSCQYTLTRLWNCFGESLFFFLKHGWYFLKWAMLALDPHYWSRNHKAGWGEKFRRPNIILHGICLRWYLSYFQVVGGCYTLAFLPSPGCTGECQQLKFLSASL